MKKCFAIILVFILLLSGCFRLSTNEPQTLSANGKSYKTGFYGTLFPKEYELQNQRIKINNINLTKIKHNKFELYHADIGSYTEGTIYCAEEDYQNAFNFYSDPENYSYHCIIGVDTDTTEAESIEIPKVDTNKFDALLEFANKSGYDPFDDEHNAKIEKIELPMPDDTKDIRLVFYKESLDSLFVSTTGSEYYIINNSLYLAYQYDFGHGEYEKLIAVKVPDDISSYFVDFMKVYI